MNTSKMVKVGVIGVGHLGQHHVKHFASLANTELVGVYDLNPTRANEIANQYNVKERMTLAHLEERTRIHQKIRLQMLLRACLGGD